MRKFELGRGGRRSWTGPIAAILIALGAFLSASPAWAHGAGETEEGYQLVQQALGHLAHDSGMLGMESATEKINDALATKDQEGVDVVVLKQAKAALDAGQVEQGRTLLEKSIAAALSKQMPAIGEATGTTVVLSALPAPTGLSGRDWSFLVISVVLLLAGAAFAVKYRPGQNIKALRGLLGQPLPRTDKHSRPTTTNMGA